MGLTIDLYANDGSPLGLTPEMIYTRGVGGAELAMMTWAETMAGRGHEVRVFNNPGRPGNHNGVLYLPQGAFNPTQKRDVFIAYRSPNPFIKIVKAGLKIHWSCDQYTVGDFRRDIVPYVDKVVCISPYHEAYYRERYGGDVGYLDLGVRLEDYGQGIEKSPGRCIFCSVPDRGLVILRHVWPAIKAAVPYASLVITSDYRLWGAPDACNSQHKMSWRGLPDVEFVGAIPRRQLIEEQLRATCQPYSATYEELFCISAAECQVAGATPVTTPIGALQTTNQWGKQIKGEPTSQEWQGRFIEAVVKALTGNGKGRQAMQRQARRRFDWNVICEQWERLIETGEFR